MARPEPVPTRETAPFWAAAREGLLRLPECATCKRLYYPPPPRCPQCLGDALAWKDLTGRARVRSWTCVELPTIPGVRPPFTLAEVEIAEQPELILVAQVQDALARRLSTGLDVSIVFETDGAAAYPWIAEAQE